MPSLISDEYKAQLEQLHRERPDFGTSSPMYAPLIKGIINKYKCEDMLDYGAGKQALKAALRIKEGYYAYDPAIPEISDVPNPRQLVICSDVLEHVELGREDAIIKDLARCTQKVGFFAIHTGKAMHHLPDGRNAHLIQQPARWWVDKLIPYFNLRAMEAGDNGFWIIVEPL